MASSSFLKVLNMHKEISFYLGAFFLEHVFTILVWFDKIWQLMGGEEYKNSSKRLLLYVLRTVGLPKKCYFTHCEK